MFARAYKVDMNEAKESQFQAYATFNEFLFCALKDGARPIVEGDKPTGSPADGAVSQLGQIQDDQILQAKGHSFYTL